jgi:hypothetical protein
MTDNSFPIPSPPPELVVKWIKSARYKDFMPYPEGYEQYEQRLTTIAARWGADMELEACCEWLDRGFGDVGNFSATLRASRRPKPPSLKEQALETLKYPKDFWSQAEVDTIRLALEQLDD